MKFRRSFGVNWCKPTVRKIIRSCRNFAWRPEVTPWLYNDSRLVPGCPRSHPHSPSLFELSAPFMHKVFEFPRRKPTLPSVTATTFNLILVAYSKIQIDEVPSVEQHFLFLGSLRYKVQNDYLDKLYSSY